MPNITTCSVRVMRSHDYCHFEVILTGTPADGETHVTLGDIDDLRKHAARLADKAVEQYKLAKSHLEMRESMNGWTWKQAQIEFERIDAMKEEDRTPEEKALWKRHKDVLFHASRHYDYEDDWQTFNDED